MLELGNPGASSSQYLSLLIALLRQRGGLTVGDSSYFHVQSLLVVLRPFTLLYSPILYLDQTQWISKTLFKGRLYFSLTSVEEKTGLICSRSKWCVFWLMRPVCQTRPKWFGPSGIFHRGQQAREVGHVCERWHSRDPKAYSQSLSASVLQSVGCLSLLSGGKGCLLELTHCNGLNRAVYLVPRRTFPCPSMVFQGWGCLSTLHDVSGSWKKDRFQGSMLYSTPPQTPYNAFHTPNFCSLIFTWRKNCPIAD